MIRILLIFFLINLNIFSSNLKDKTPSLVSQSDLKLMNEFDNLAYSLSDVKLKELDIKKIYNFIKLNKKYIIDYSLMTINFTASTGIDDYDYESDRERDKDYRKVGIQLKYPIYDNKIRKDIKNKELEYHSKILTQINKYTKLRDKLIALKRELKFSRLLQIREKLQVKSGIKYLDERLKTLEKILILQNNILETKSNLEVNKFILLNFVKDNYKKGLEKIL